MAQIGRRWGVERGMGQGNWRHGVVDMVRLAVACFHVTPA